MADVRVSQFGVEILTQPPSDVRVSQFGVEIITRENKGTVTITAPTIFGSGEVITNPSGSGSVTVSVPVIEASGVFTPQPIEGSGSVTVSVPSISGNLLAGPVKLTQMGRSVLTSNDADTIKVTQLGRRVVEEFASPSLRLTQMARQVLYRYTCASEPASPVLDYPTVHITQASIKPLWKLLRFDINPRMEESNASVEQNTYSTSPSWTDDGLRWQLLRFDVKVTKVESNVAPEAVTGPITPSATSWQLFRADLKYRTEESE